MEWFTVSDCFQDVSSFLLLVVVLLHGDNLVQRVILGDLRDLTARVLCRLCCDSVGVVTSFTLFFPLPLPLPLPFFPLVLGGQSLLVSLNQQSLLMWHVRPHRKQLDFCPSVSLFPLPLWLLPFFVKASISMSSGPFLLLGDTVTPA